jgi:hypothetical protein
MGHGKDLDLMGYDFSDKEMYSVMLEDYPDKLGAKYVMSPSDTFSYGRAYEYFDVSLVPLNNTKFNNCKSDLKISEAGFSKTAVIASNVTPYKDKGEWKEAIESMTMPEANRLANNLYDYCVEHYHIDKLNQIRINSMIK